MTQRDERDARLEQFFGYRGLKAQEVEDIRSLLKEARELRAALLDALHDDALTTEELIDQVAYTGQVQAALDRLVREVRLEASTFEPCNAPQDYCTHCELLAMAERARVQPAQGREEGER